MTDRRKECPDQYGQPVDRREGVADRRTDEETRELFEEIAADSGPHWRDCFAEDLRELVRRCIARAALAQAGLDDGSGEP